MINPAPISVYQKGVISSYCPKKEFWVNGFSRYREDITGMIPVVKYFQKKNFMIKEIEA